MLDDQLKQIIPADQMPIENREHTKGQGTGLFANDVHNVRYGKCCVLSYVRLHDAHTWSYPICHSANNRSNAFGAHA